MASEKAESDCGRGVDLGSPEVNLTDIEHDLRNSLSGVLLGCDVLSSSIDLEQIREVTVSIERQVMLMSRRFDELLRAYKRDRVGIPWESASLQDSVAEVGHDGFFESSSNIQRDHASSLRILAIDDRVDILLALRVLLTNDGHVFSEANGIETGLETALSFKPDIIFCDIELADDANGLELARRVRADSRFGEVYLVALSGYSDDQHRQDAMEAGFDLQISKPIGLKALRKVIANRPVLECRPA